MCITHEKKEIKNVENVLQELEEFEYLYKSCKTLEILILFKKLAVLLSILRELFNRVFK